MCAFRCSRILQYRVPCSDALCHGTPGAADLRRLVLLRLDELGEHDDPSFAGDEVCQPDSLLSAVEAQLSESAVELAGVRVAKAPHPSPPAGRGGKGPAPTPDRRACSTRVRSPAPALPYPTS